MKKKFFSFILAICLLIPCMFGLVGCSDGDDGINLAGKTIVIGNGHYNDDAEICIVGYYDVPNEKQYERKYTAEQFAEEFYDTRVFSSIFDNPEIDTAEEAKSALINYAKNEVSPRFSSYKFSADASTVTEYASSDTTYSNPLNTYTVELEQQHTRRIYHLYDGATYWGNIDCTNIIQVSPVLGYYGVEIDLSEFTDIMVTLTAEDGATCQKPLSDGVKIDMFYDYTYKIAE